MKSDLGLGFNRRNWTFFRSALYLCNQKIYSPRHRHGSGVNWTRVSADRPLRCVLYNEWPENNPACSDWLGTMTERFEIRNRQTFVINESSYRDDGTDIEDRYTVIEFVPRHGTPARQIALVERRKINVSINRIWCTLLLFDFKRGRSLPHSRHGRAGRSRVRLLEITRAIAARLGRSTVSDLSLARGTTWRLHGSRA